MAASASAFNSTDMPVVIDGDGRRLDGKTHGKVDPALPEVKAAVLAGSLVVSETIEDRIEAEAQTPAAGTPAPANREKGSRR